MKKSIVFVFAAVLALNTAVAGNSNSLIEKDPKAITEQVAELLKSPEFEVTEEILTKVTLVVNSDQEIFVLDIDTEDEEVESYIKSRLNYAKLPIGKTGEQIVLPLRIVPAD